VVGQGNEKKSSTIKKRRRKEQYMNRLRLKAEGGFTLIELLVVIAIIGILAAIAIPQFAAYRKRAFDTQVKADLRNGATAEEAWYASQNPSVYMPAGDFVTGTPPGFSATAGVTITAAAPTATTFVLTGVHVSCPATTWTYTSNTGQITGGPCP
jgi:type IV pilus assembly protein PilA